MQKNGSASIRNMPTCFAERSYPKRAFPETDIRFGESAFSVLFLRQPLQSGANIPFQQRGHAFGVTGKVRAQERLSGSRKAARAGCCKLGQPLNAPACSGRLFVCGCGQDTAPASPLPAQGPPTVRCMPAGPCPACVHKCVYRPALPQKHPKRHTPRPKLHFPPPAYTGLHMRRRCSSLSAFSPALQFAHAPFRSLLLSFCGQYRHKIHFSPKTARGPLSSPVGRSIAGHIRSAPQAPPVSAHDC